MTDWIGWAATALFTSSYLCRTAAALRRVQMIAALVWVGYGALVGAAPVVVANLLVLGAAAAASWKDRAVAPAGGPVGEAG